MRGRAAFLALALAIASLFGPSGPAHAQAAVEAEGLAVQALRDGGGGYELRLATSLRLAPELAETAHAPGEGHARLAIDGKPGQPAGAVIALKGLTAGAHRLELGLFTNDGRPYVSGGKPLVARFVLGVPRPARGPAPAGAARRGGSSWRSSAARSGRALRLIA